LSRKPVSKNRSGHPLPPKTPVWGGLICWTSPKTPVWGGLICWTPPKTPVWGGLICGHQVDRDRGPGPYPVASPVQFCKILKNAKLSFFVLRARCAVQFSCTANMRKC
jgi:hypothetical protein